MSRGDLAWAISGYAAFGATGALAYGAGLRWKFVPFVVGGAVWAVIGVGFAAYFAVRWL